MCVIYTGPLSGTLEQKLCQMYICINWYVSLEVRLNLQELEDKDEHI